MSTVVKQRPQEPFLVVSPQANDPCADLVLKPEDCVHAAPGVRASVDVVAEQHDGVTTGGLAAKLAEDVVEGREVAVDITDGDCGHVKDYDDDDGAVQPRLPESRR